LIERIQPLDSSRGFLKQRTTGRTVLAMKIEALPGSCAQHAIECVGEQKIKFGTAEHRTAATLKLVPVFHLDRLFVNTR